MSHRLRKSSIWLTIFATLASGCQPTQPFFFMEDGDLSHYIDVATEIEYPDVEEPSLAEVDGAQAPLTIENFDQYQMWDLTLEEASRITLENSDIMRQLGGRVVSSAPDTISRSLIQSGVVNTTYDPALTASAYGANTGVAQSGTGVEAALAEFDASLLGSVFWEKNNRPQNTTFFARSFEQETGRFSAEINKFAADGTRFAIRNNTVYDGNNNTFRGIPSDWTTNIEASFTHPLFAGRGTQYNRIAGPHSFEQFNSGFANPFDGVVIARIREDVALADFEGGVRNLMRDTEVAYWELYFAYRNLEAQKAGQKSALATWKTINELRKVGDRRGAAHEEARARAQVFFFRSQVESTVTELLKAENRLRYIMGLAMSDGRLIRPSDEPTMAKVDFEWLTTHCEALARRVEIRKQKWNVKRRELELIAAKNHLMPRLDAVGQYRWLGLGDHLFGTSPGSPVNSLVGTSAVENLVSGDFQEWQLGLQFSMPIGMRQGHTMVRHHQLLIARERALLQDLELEVSHQLGDAIRDVALNHRLGQTQFNRYSASLEEVRSYAALFEAGSNDPVTGQPVTADIVLEAQRRQFDAVVTYYRALVDYNLSILRVHERKGSLLDYNGIYLAEGPWPAKAYFDALRRARQRDASMQLDYGFTRPGVFSRGPYRQEAGVDGGETVWPEHGEIIHGETIFPSSPAVEEIPSPTDAPNAPYHGSPPMTNHFNDDATTPQPASSPNGPSGVTQASAVFAAPAMAEGNDAPQFAEPSPMHRGEVASVASQAIPASGNTSSANHVSAPASPVLSNTAPAHTTPIATARITPAAENQTIPLNGRNDLRSTSAPASVENPFRSTDGNRPAATSGSMNRGAYSAPSGSTVWRRSSR